MLNTYTLRNQYLAFILIIAVCWGCTETIVETVYETLTDTLYTTVFDTVIVVETDTVITYAQISVNLRSNGRWGSNYLVAYFIGSGVNVSNDTINNVSVKITLSREKFMVGILSETTGYFVIGQPLATYIPNDPFPYEIQHSFEPFAGHNFYASADTVFDVNSIFWYFGIIVNDGLSKRAWQYGGIIER